MAEQVWPDPSESRRVRRRLYLVEGTVLGGFGALFVLGPVAGVLAALARGTFRVPGDLVALVPLLAVVFARRLVVVGESRETNWEPRSTKRDWRETREWQWVAVVAAGVWVVSALVALLVWGPPTALSGPVSLLGFPGAGLGVVGVAGYVYTWHRLGGALV